MSQEQKGRSDLLQIWHLGAWHRAGLWELLPLNLYQTQTNLSLSCKGVGTLEGGPDPEQEKALTPKPSAPAA